MKLSSCKGFFSASLSALCIIYTPINKMFSSAAGVLKDDKEIFVTIGIFTLEALDRQGHGLDRQAVVFPKNYCASALEGIMKKMFCYRKLLPGLGIR